MKRTIYFMATLALMLILAACGGTPEPEPTATPEPVPTEEPAPEPTPEPEPTEEEMMEEEMESSTIVDVAVADGRFQTLVAAVTAADLVETLSGEGPFTVFAPTDDAFAALPEGTVEGLLEDPSGALTDVLLYHVVSGAVPAETVVGLDSATTVGGSDVSIAVVDGGVVLNDSVNVVITDIMTDNGIIHVIDAVLLPPSMMAEEEEMMDEEMMEEPTQTIAEIASEAGSFNTLVAALDAAGLVDTFAGEGDFTVFAPTDDAFAALPEGTVESLLEDPQGALTQILTYHVVEGSVLAETVVTLDSATTLQGEDVSIAVVDGGVVLNDSVKVVTTDLKATNGVIHVIDAVLLPPSISQTSEEEVMDDEMMDEPTQSIAEIAVEAGTFNTLVAALDAAGLVDTLAGEGDFTVFAPTDDAFAALPEGTVESLLEDPQGALTQILTYHVVAGTVLAETVVTLDSATTLQGEDVSIEVVDGGVVLNGSVNVTTTDIKASNGVIHVIDAVLLPPSTVKDEGAMEEEGAMMEEPTQTIAEIAVEAGIFNTLVAALDAAGLVNTFAGEGDFTVFAPTDDAFAALPEGTVETLLEDPEGALTNILLYHVVEGSVLAETVVTLDSATTLLGQDVTISVTDDGVFLNDTVQVVTTDIKATNGVIHVIDAVLIPAE
ncbi:MAG: fasciclin domain-containing protein [Chloroflexota bacterium]